MDKPSGLTSRQAGWRVAKLFKTKKFGHIGTLDPMASGLLVIALGEATKMIPFLETVRAKDKEYMFSIKWGIKTDAGDITGKVTERGGRIPEKNEIAAALPELIGEYDQTPPAFSAKKIDGVAAYKSARGGNPVELRPARVAIYGLCIRDSTGAIDDIVYYVKCGPGTYIRSLVQDIAERISNPCHSREGGNRIATCSMIRRTKSGGFDIKDAVELDFLENLYNNSPNMVQEHLRPVDFGLDGIPVGNLNDDDARLFENGGIVVTKDDSTGLRRVYSDKRFLGIGMNENYALWPKRIVASKVEIRDT